MVSSLALGDTKLRYKCLHACNCHIRNGRSLPFPTYLANDSLHAVPNTWQQEKAQHAQKQRKYVTVSKKVVISAKKGMPSISNMPGKNNRRARRRNGCNCHAYKKMTML